MATKDINEVKRILEDIRNKKMLSKELEFEKRQTMTFVRIPKITSQFLGQGRNKTKAYMDAILTLEEIERRWI
jgi:hypothetical protein